MSHAPVVPAPSGVQEDFGWALATVLRTYLRTADGVLDGIPGGPRGYRVLASVARDCPTSQLALAQLVGLDRTVVTYLLDDLVTAGLVERTADPADRRTRRVVATDAGRERLCQAERELRGVEDRLLRALQPAEATAFRALLQRIAVGLTSDASAGDACTVIEDVRGT